MNDSQKIKGAEKIITHCEADAWRVVSGNVLIYVAPWNDETLGRRVFVCEATPGEVIPSLSFKDYKHTQWRFCFVAVEAAELSVIKGGSTNILKSRFSERAKLDDTAHEGFDQAVINFYKLKTVAEDGLIQIVERERKTTSENILKLIYNVFNKKQLRIKTKKAGNALYDAAAIICGKAGIPIAPLEKVIEACPTGFTIYDIARVSHFTCREVVQEKNWHTSDSGALLAFDKNNSPVACLPKGQHRYVAHYVEKGDIRTLSGSEARELNPRTYTFYRSLPNKPIGAKELFHYCIKSVKTVDIAQILIFTAICTLIGLLIPQLNQMLFDTFIPLGVEVSVMQIGLLIGSAMIGSIFFSVAKNIVNFRVGSRISVDLQCAMQGRLFNMPMKFYRQYESADLAHRMMGMSSVVGAIVNAVLATGLTAVLSIAYFIQMAQFSPHLSWVAVLMLLLYAATIILISGRERKYQAQIEELNGKVSSALYQYVNGIAKLRMSGAEDRALFEYMKMFVKTREIDRKQNAVSSISTVLAISSSAIFSVVLYWLLIHGDSDVSIGGFIAFMAAFGVFSGAFMDAVSEISNLRVLKAAYERSKPLLAETPEFDEAKELPGKLSGELEINNVTFSYAKDAPLVLDNLSLQIKAGEYVGVVGPSGCGKSTLFRLLLGFETPNTGKVYYDGKDIENLDKRELRKKMGVVLQDGKLISGSIFENITITSPKSTLKDAQEVVKEVGLEKDIEEMPMGLHTVLSEDCGTISGGQQQRILIARAIIAKPGILFFDEATSALDNVTQAMVCESLDSMNATRLVIAHRLSTIMNCDRIIVMDAGRIVEQGSYQELMDAQGLFYELASRQIV